jgi:N-dimethylarginine dimethylaminohydrolase
MVYHRVSDLDFTLGECPKLPRPKRVLMTTPEHFEVAYVINPHMEGHAGAVDRQEALRQWTALRETYAALGFEVQVMEGRPGLPDMVFCANQTLPYPGVAGGRGGVVLGRMHASPRRAEVPHVAAFFRDLGYATKSLPGHVRAFEGMGDALRHPGRALLWGGYGFRTDPSAYEALTAMLGVPVLALHLEDPDFYHLDTCLCILDETTALIYPGAFDADGLGLLRRLFPRLLEAPEDEARRRLACNAHSPDGRHVMIQRGNAHTCRILNESGFTPLEIETGEFLKAGGSVFCMKLMFW